MLQRILTERRTQWQATHPGKKYQEPTSPDKSGLFFVPTLPKTWTWASIDQITENHDATRVPVKKSDRDEMKLKRYPYYGAFGIIDAVDDYLFDGNFLLLAEDGKNLQSRNKPISFLAEGKFWVNNHAHVMKMYLECPLGYLEAYLNSTDISRYLTGMDQVKLTRNDMNRIPVALPPLAEQHRIVAEVERRLSVITTLEQTITTNLARAERLRQSILHRAFTGQLVTGNKN